MLQNAPIGALHKRVRAYPEHHIHLLFPDFDPFHQRSNDLAPLQPIRPGEPVPHLLRKRVEASNNQPEFVLQGGYLRELLSLFLQAGNALP